MIEEKVDLTKGGVAVVMIGHTGLVKEYINNPAIRFIECKLVEGDQLATLVPDNTKAVIVTEGVPQYHYTWITSFAKRKNIPYLVRKSNQAIYETLKSFLPNGNRKVDQAEVKETQKRGKLKDLIALVDWNDSNANQARRLLVEAKERNIATTFGSLAQMIAVERRKKGLGTIPKSARSQLDISVEMLDNMVKDLTSMRDYLVATVEENRILRDKVEKFRKVLD